MLFAKKIFPNQTATDATAVDTPNCSETSGVKACFELLFGQIKQMQSDLVEMVSFQNKLVASYKVSSF